MTALLLEGPVAANRSDPASAPTAPLKARVLHLINGDDYSGAERVQDLLAMRLGDFGYEVGIVCTKPGRFRQARQARDVPLYELPMRSRFDLRPVVSLARLIRREGYRLLHTHSARTALIGRPAAALAGVPWVHHMHCQTSSEVERRWLSRLNSLIERLSLHGAAAVVAVSETLREYTQRRGTPDAAVSLIPNGVPSPAMLRSDDPPAETWTIGTVAMFRPRKGIEVLLEAVSILRRRGLPVRLKAVGCFQTPEYERHVRQLVETLGLAEAVEWTGFVCDVDRELAQMDVVVLPSIAPEGLPMAVLEAMAAGVPVVGTRVDGVIDVIEEGRTGLLAKANDAGDLARVLARLVEAEVDWSALRACALSAHRERYSDVSMAAGIAALYERILSE